jgi:hypothetical protein
MNKRTLTLLIAIGVTCLNAAEPLNYRVSWLGNSFSGASNKSVQNFVGQKTGVSDKPGKVLHLQN